MRITTEIYRLGLVFSVPAMLLAAFPYRAIGFKAAPAKARPAPGCRIVELTEAEEREALARARTSWATDASDLRKIRLDLVDSDMTDPGIGELVDYTPPKVAMPEGGFKPQLLPPTVGAPPPPEMAREAPKAAELPFSKAELLELNIEKGKL